MWFALNQANAIGHIGMDGEIAVHPPPTAAAAPVGIATGRDGVLWTALEMGAVARVAVTS